MTTCIEGWADWEVGVLLANPKVSDRSLQLILRKHGSGRTTYAVAAKRRALGLFKKPGDPTQAMVRAGWPEMKGEPEDRDRVFWKAVLVHAVECGVITIAKTPTTPLPKGMAA